MKKCTTELVFILDRSGSMSGLESDTISGYNGMLEKQKKEAGKAGLGIHFPRRQHRCHRYRQSVWDLESRATNFHADHDGTKLNYNVISETISSFRAHSEIREDWKEKIEKDFIKRSSKR